MASAAATPSYASTKETTNYARLCRLLVDVGSQALRNKFDSIHPPAGLHGVVTKPPVHPILQTLRKKRILNPTQWAKLYPPSPSSVSSKDFDVTLLMLLLRNVCGLIAPTTGWDNLPPVGDTSAEANIARVKYYRNHVYGHASQASVDDATFNSYWQDISYALVGLGADSAAINRLKTESMDPVIEQHYRELLREWKKDDDSSKDRLDEIEGLIKKLKKDNDNSRVKLEEQLKNMNDQILESEKKIREKLEGLTADPVEEANQEKDKEKLEEIKGEITAIREKLDALTSAGQESNDKGSYHGEASIASGTVRPGVAAGPSDLNMKQTHHDQGGFYPTGSVDGIRQLYSTRERWFAPFPWWEKFRLSLDNNFTRLKIVSRKKARGTKTDQTVTMKDIFKPHKECDHPRTVLIEGRPGIGKTTFCNKLAYDWAANKQVAEDPSESFFPNFQVVLLIKCREIESCLSEATEGQPLPRSEKEKLNEIFKSVLWDAIDDQLLPRDCTKEDKEEFFKFIRCNQPDILLVLDGLDELPTNMFAAFKEVIQGRMLPKCYIVATARQEVGMEVRECCDTLLEIEGFTKEDAREFIFRYFDEEPHLAQRLLKKLESDENLQQLTESPLNTVLLCLLCEDSDGIFAESGTQLYLEMVECVLRRYRKKKGLPLPNTKDEDLTKVYKTQLRQLGSIAWNGLLHNNMSLEEGEFKNCSEELPEFGFLSVECSPQKVRPSLNYSFLHKTFQELFAAFYLCCLVLENEICPETLIADDKYFKELKQVLLFTCGMLASQSEEAIKAFVSCIAKKVKDKATFSVALECIKECKNEKSCTLHLLLARTLGSLVQITQLDLVRNGLGTGDCTALAEAIKHNSTITQLDLAGNGLGTGDCTVLAEAIKHNSTIRQLDLAGNGLGTGDCTALAEAIKHNSTITQLNLRYNQLGTGDCTALAEAIKHNSTITQLNLRGNGLGTGDCTALAEAIKHNSTITQLDLS
ncbi:hypothetical protein ABFA07_023255 [Porites harrisoni]